MTNEKPKESTPETKRAHALENLTKRKELLNAATALFVEKGQYGEAGASAVEEFLYKSPLDLNPKYNTLEDGTEVDVVRNQFLASRQGGKRYSGTISEYKIIEECAAIVQQSLLALQVQDVMKLVGSKQNGGEKADVYLSALAESKKDEDKNLFHALIGSYISYLTDTKVAEALSERAKTIPKNLEKILGEEEKK